MAGARSEAFKEVVDVSFIISYSNKISGCVSNSKGERYP